MQVSVFFYLDIFYKIYILVYLILLKGMLKFSILTQILSHFIYMEVRYIFLFTEIPQCYMNLKPTMCDSLYIKICIRFVTNLIIMTLNFIKVILFRNIYMKLLLKS